MNYIWSPPTYLPDGHRLFVAVAGDSERVAIADDSGKLPQTTDDGVLWLDFNQPLSILKDKTADPPREHFAIPLKDEAGERTRTPTDAVTIITLSEKYAWSINVQGILFKSMKVY